MTRTRKIAIIVTGLIAVTLLGAGSCDAENTSSDAAKAARAKEQASTVLCGDPKESLECKNLKERERRMNQPNAIGYVYLYNFDGSIKGYFTIKGKVSSTQSQMGPTDTMIYDQGQSGGGNLVVEAPGDDGSYGPNESGIFFFTTEGVMVTYSGDYVYSDAPLKLTTTRLN